MDHDEQQWGDCNKCGQVEVVNPATGVCEYCGCTDPEGEYPADSTN